MIQKEAFIQRPEAAAAIAAEEVQTTTEPVEIEKKKKHEHWWQSIPRRLSLTRRSSESESECASGSLTSPTSSSPEADKWKDDKKNIRRTSSTDHESRAAMKERLIRTQNVPPDMFIPPWF